MLSYRFCDCDQNIVRSIGERTLWLRPQVEMRNVALETSAKVIMNSVHRKGCVSVS